MGKVKPLAITSAVIVVIASAMRWVGNDSAAYFLLGLAIWGAILSLNE